MVSRKTEYTIRIIRDSRNANLDLFAKPFNWKAMKSTDIIECNNGWNIPAGYVCQDITNNCYTLINPGE